MLSPIWALAIAVFAVGVDTYIVVGILPQIARDLGEPIAAVGLVASAYALPTAFLAPIFGPFSDRHGRRAALSLGLTIFVASAAVCIVAPTLLVLLVARAVNGLGAAVLMPAAFAFAGDLPGQSQRQRAMGIVSSSFPLATLLGLPIGTLAALLGGWRGAFLFVTLVGLAALVLVRIVCPADAPRSARPLGYLESYRTVLRDRRGLAMLSVTFVWFIAPLGLFIYFAEFIHVTFGIPAAQAGLSLIMVGIVGVIASRASGRVMGRIGARAAVLVAITVFATSALLMPLSTSALPLSLLVLGLWAAGTWFGVPAMQAIVAAHSEHLRGTMLAFNTSALNLAGVVGPIVIGSIIAAAGFTAAYWSAALIAGLALGLALIVLPRGPRLPAVAPSSAGMAG